MRISDWSSDVCSSDLVQAWLAEIEFDAENFAAAEAAADRAIAADPKEIAAWIYKGRAQIAAAVTANSADPSVWSEERRSLATAHHLDPDHPGPLILFYESFGGQGLDRESDGGGQ